MKEFVCIITKYASVFTVALTLIAAFISTLLVFSPAIFISVISFACKITLGAIALILVFCTVKILLPAKNCAQYNNK